MVAYSYNNLLNGDLGSLVMSQQIVQSGGRSMHDLQVWIVNNKSCGIVGLVLIVI